MNVGSTLAMAVNELKLLGIEAMRRIIKIWRTDGARPMSFASACVGSGIF